MKQNGVRRFLDRLSDEQVLALRFAIAAYGARRWHDTLRQRWENPAAFAAWGDAAGLAALEPLRVRGEPMPPQLLAMSAREVIAESEARGLRFDGSTIKPITSPAFHPFN